MYDPLYLMFQSSASHPDEYSFIALALAIMVAVFLRMIGDKE